jgi:hypothetical protein
MPLTEKLIVLIVDALAQPVPVIVQLTQQVSSCDRLGTLRHGGEYIATLEARRDKTKTIKQGMIMMTG